MRYSDGARWGKWDKRSHGGGRPYADDPPSPLLPPLALQVHTDACELASRGGRSRMPSQQQQTEVGEEEEEEEEVRGLLEQPSAYLAAPCGGPDVEAPPPSPPAAAARDARTLACE